MVMVTTTEYQRDPRKMTLRLAPWLQEQARRYRVFHEVEVVSAVAAIWR